MSPKMPKELVDIRRRQILEAAWQCFAERGYHDTTMRSIAKSMDLSTGVIYNYFKGKDEILDALMAWALEANEQLFNQMAEQTSIAEAILKLFNACFLDTPIDKLRQSAKANINIWLEATKKPNILAMIIDQFNQSRDKLAAYVSAGIKNGEVSTDLEPKSVAAFYMALITGLQVQAVLMEAQDFDSYYAEIRKILGRITNE